MTATQRAPHRFSIDDAAPVAGRVSAREAMAELEAQGLGGMSSSDLEVYQLVMSPAEFARLCARLDRAVTTVELPFGEDLRPAADLERRRQWAHRPNGEPLPRSWTVETECRVPGRLKLIEGREFTATGVRGRLRFRYAIRTVDGEFWIEAFDREGRFRSLAPGRVRRVHAKSKLHPRRGVRR